MLPERQSRREVAAETKAITDAAAAWVARRDAGLTPAEASELAAWCAADPRHRDALTRYDRLWSALDQPRGSGLAGVALQRLARQAAKRRRRRGLLAAGAAVGLVALGAVIGLPTGTPMVQTAPAASTVIVSAPPCRVLSDGSRVELNSGAEIAVDFTGSLRRVRLVKGEAHFAVAKDPARPFVVNADGVEIRAVGTAFAVALAPVSVKVLVTEGRVSVNGPAEAPASAVALADAGHAVVVPVRQPMTTAQVTAVSPEELELQLAWRGTRVEFSGTRLAEAVAMMNQHRRTRLRIAEPALAEARVSGVVRLENVEGFVRLLEATLEVRVERRPDGEMVLSRSAPAKD